MFSATCRLRHFRCLLIAISACVAISPALAAAPEFGLRDAIGAALAHNPDLAGFEFDLRTADAVREQAALRPSLVLDANLENFAGTGETQGLQSAEATFSISQIIELGGKRDARITVANVARDALTVARQAAQLDVLAEVTRRFIAVAQLQQRAHLTVSATDIAETTLQSADLRVRAARAPHVEVDRATVALELARLEARRVQGQLDAARRWLAAMWGSDDAQIDGRPLRDVSGDLFSTPRTEDFPTLLARLRTNPDFLRFASEERLRDAELRLAATQSHADISLGGGVRRLQGSHDTALVASFSIPLFAGRRAESVIAEAAARRDAVGPAREAAFVKARAQLYALYREQEDAAATVTSLATIAIPKMEEALRETQYAFGRGRYSYLELVDAQREYLDVQQLRIDAGARTQLLAAEIERLTNAPMALPQTPDSQTGPTP